MSLNQIPRDKNGKPLKLGQWVQGEIRLDRRGPPIYIFGKLVVPSGPNRSLIQADEGRSHVVENSKIEIKID